MTVPNTNCLRQGLLLAMAASAVEGQADTVKLPNKVRLGIIGYDGHVSDVLGPLRDFPDLELGSQLAGRRSIEMPGFDESFSPTRNRVGKQGWTTDFDGTHAQEPIDQRSKASNARGHRVRSVAQYASDEWLRLGFASGSRLWR